MCIRDSLADFREVDSLSVSNPAGPPFQVPVRVILHDVVRGFLEKREHLVEHGPLQFRLISLGFHQVVPLRPFPYLLRGPPLGMSGIKREQYRRLRRNRHGLKQCGHLGDLVRAVRHPDLRNRDSLALYHCREQRYSAMIQREGITIAQVRVPDGTNEITQVPALLEAMPVPAQTPVLFTLDAAHTQRGTAKEIRERPEWHYLMEAKGNQPKLQRAVFDKVLPLFKETPHDIMEDDSHGHLKRWSCWITDAEGIDFPEVCQVGAIRRDVFDRSGDRISKEIALVLT